MSKGELHEIDTFGGRNTEFRSVGHEFKKPASVAVWHLAEAGEERQHKRGTRSRIRRAETGSRFGTIPGDMTSIPGYSWICPKTNLPRNTVQVEWPLSKSAE